MEKKKFNKREYDNQYQRENYLQFKAKLKPEEKLEIDRWLNEVNLNKTEFIREAYLLMKEKYKKKE
ncbi:MAG TPA: hypothetical protein DCE23_07720 [Firmicutes bacterium]|nr:hypothetical protein [Bacillota bacterium]